MYKKLLALSLALVLCVCPVFAVSDADNSYYGFESVSNYSLGSRSLSTLAATGSGLVGVANLHAGHGQKTGGGHRRAEDSGTH